MKSPVFSLKLLILWVVSIAAALWGANHYYKTAFGIGSEWRSYANELPVSWQPLLDHIPEDDDEAHLLHFWAPDCESNEVVVAYLTDLGMRYAHQGVHLVLVGKPRLLDQRLWSALIHAWNGQIGVIQEPLVADIPPMPAALILDQHKNPVYFGPYTDVSGDCGSVASTGLVETPLQSISMGIPLPVRTAMQFGCACQKKNLNQQWVYADHEEMGYFPLREVSF
ncbi:hypothetical protein ACKC9G_16045 [Pokkaliibacter sp. CJK22405]|uniref:DUF6436 domain-containing protein n=1 Tax=Pokkaliibacter sp. CJK22405 TaxID=3384615 RepID=UPI0039846EFA